MHVPDHVRARLRAVMDDPDHRAKTVAALLGRSRATLYRILNGQTGPKTLRKVLSTFPEAEAAPNDTD